MADVDHSEDWRCGCSDVSSMLAKARKKGLFIDVRFLVGREGAARYLSAHKMILACGSPVFEAMFFGFFTDKKDPIVIPDDDPEAFQIMIQYLYGEVVSFPGIIVACKTHCIGDKYLIPQLQKMAANYLSTTHMDDVSFWELLEGNLLACKVAEEKFAGHLQANAERLLRSEQFLDATEDVVKMVLQMDVLHIKELDLLSFVAKWAAKNYTEENKWKSQTLLQNIRFSVITPKEFCSFHESFPDALDTATSLRILKHLSDSKNYQLPYWCSTNTQLRTPTFAFQKSHTTTFTLNSPFNANGASSYSSATGFTFNSKPKKG